MKLAVMQPYFFPYLGYFQLLMYADHFVFFDVVQYNKRSWMNRNRVMGFNSNDQYISLPIRKHRGGTLINEVYINNDEKWKQRILGQLTVYKYLKAPFYNEVMSLVEDIFSKPHDSLLSLVIDSISSVFRYLGLHFSYSIASDIPFNRDGISSPDDWALAISNHLNAIEYINPDSGYALFDEAKYKEKSISLKFLSPNLVKYKQGWKDCFIEGLSVLDVLFFNSKEMVSDKLLFDFYIKTKKDLIQPGASL